MVSKKRCQYNFEGDVVGYIFGHHRAIHVIPDRSGLFGLFWATFGHFGSKKLVFQYSTQNLSKMFFGHPVEASFKAASRS